MVFFHFPLCNHSYCMYLSYLGFKKIGNKKLRVEHEIAMIIHPTKLATNITINNGLISKV